VIAFFWAVDHDQFDDLETPKLLPLLDNPHAGGQESTRDPRRPGKDGDDAKFLRDNPKGKDDDDRHDHGDWKRPAVAGRGPRT
jgi:nitrogen fixation-related uncharacterized protein